jgi:hypothetical protein
VVEVAKALPQFLDHPKVWTPHALAVGIAEGAQQGVFGYAATAGESDGAITVSAPSSIRLREPLAPEQVQLGEGAVLMSVTLADRLTAPAGAGPPPPPPPPPPPGPGQGPGAGPASGSALGGEATGLQLEIAATEDDLFVLNQSLSKLRELLGGGTMRLNVSVEARTSDGQPLDRIRARNTVIEPLEEDPDVRVQAQWLAPPGAEADG